MLTDTERRVAAGDVLHEIFNYPLRYSEDYIEMLVVDKTDTHWVVNGLSKDKEIIHQGILIPKRNQT